MNLTELQMELRAMEVQISSLHHEIEKMKQKPKVGKKTEFEKITKLADRYPMFNSKINGAPEEIKRLMIGTLSYLFFTEGNDLYNRLLYLCRLARGNGYHISAEELYKTGLTFEMPDVDEFSRAVEGYKYTFLVEAFILANLSGEASDDILSVIADFAEAMHCDKEEICVLGMVAKGVLMDNLDCILEMPVPAVNRWSGKLRDFITEDWLAKQRELCGQLCTDSGLSYILVCEIRECMRTGSIVKKGDIICSYTEKENNRHFLLYKHGEHVEKNITAPCDGVVNIVEDKREGAGWMPDEYMSIYVVSYFDDDLAQTEKRNEDEDI